MNHDDIQLRTSYAARAQEYEAVHARPERQADLRAPNPGQLDCRASSRVPAEAELRQVTHDVGHPFEWIEWPYFWVFAYEKRGV
ncbi:MAG: hypothetical protein RR784_11925 [Burkholderiaceae bacterium]